MESSKKSLGQKSLIGVVVVFALLLLGFAISGIIKIPSFQEMQKDKSGVQRDNITDNMNLTSPAFENQQKIPSRFTCDAENVSPPLSISEVPSQAKSLVLIVDDPDAPGGDWVHWLVWNIDPKVSQIKEGDVPIGAVQGRTDFGKYEYGGPCPPSGTHKYQFNLYALDATLDLAVTSKKGEVESAIEGHILDQTILVGTYSRG